VVHNKVDIIIKDFDNFINNDFNKIENYVKADATTNPSKIQIYKIKIIDTTIFDTQLIDTTENYVTTITITGDAKPFITKSG